MQVLLGVATGVAFIIVLWFISPPSWWCSRRAWAWARS
jgi:hypothetical protein